MRQQFATLLVALCVLTVMVGCVLGLNPRSQHGRPLVLGGAMALAAVLFWHSCQLRHATLIDFLVGAAVPVA